MRINAKNNGAATFKCVSGSLYLYFLEMAGERTALRELPILGKLMHMPNAN